MSLARWSVLGLGLALAVGLGTAAQAAPKIKGIGYCAGVEKAFDPNNDDDFADRNDVAAMAAAEACMKRDQLQGLYSRANVHRLAGRKAEAEADVASALALDPSYAPAWRTRCSILTGDKSYVEAKAACDKAIALAPDWASAWQTRGYLHFVQNAFDASIADYDKVLSLDPKIANALNNRGAGKKGKNDNAGALADYEAALKLHPTSAFYMRNVAGAYRALKDDDHALKLLTAALAIRPDSVDVLRDRAALLTDRKDYAGALRDYNVAIAAAPSDAGLHSSRGWVHNHLGAYEPAAADFQKAGELSPTWGRPWADRAYMLTRLGRHDEAITSADKAIAISPKEPAGFNNRGVAKKGKGDLLGALADYQAAAAINPSSTLYRGNITEVTGLVDKAFTGQLQAARSLIGRHANRRLESCETEGVSADDYIDALYESVDRKTDAETIFGDKAASRRASYIRCLTNSRDGIVKAITTAQKDVSGLVAAQAKSAAELESACKATPAARAVCEPRQQEMRALEPQVRAALANWLTTAATQRAQAETLLASGPARYDAAVASARSTAFGQALAAYDEDSLPSLEADAAFLRNAKAVSFRERCGQVQLYAPRDGQPDTVNPALQRYRECISALDDDAWDRVAKYSAIQNGMLEQRQANEAYRLLVCSRNNTPGCIPDDLWDRRASIANASAVETAKFQATRARALPDEVRAELVRLNNLVDQINAQTARNNVATQTSNFLGALASAFNAASSQPTYTTPPPVYLPGIR